MNPSIFSSQYRQMLERVLINPVEIQKYMHQQLESLTSGEVFLVDASNPLVYALEASAMLGANSLDEGLSHLRGLYARLAARPEDLYRHMSDKEYLGRFATPSKTFFTVVIEKEEFENAAVVDPITGVKKLTLPRNSVFYIDTVPFSIQYPINIEMLSHGGIQVSWDASIPSPLLTLSTNQIKSAVAIRTSDQTEHITMVFETLQFDVLSSVHSYSLSTGVKIKVPFKEQYWFLRAYIKTASNPEWTEIKTTHSDLVYDATVLTAQLVHRSGEIELTIPTIYFSKGMIDTGHLRVDLYQTKGELSMSTDGFSSDLFSAKWLAIDSRDDTVYTAPVSSLKNIVVFTSEPVTGGSHAKSFEVLRQEVIESSVGNQVIPITQSQILRIDELIGYEIIKGVDHLTDRVFLACRSMPEPDDPALITPVGALMTTLIGSLEEMITYPGVMDNGERITLTPGALFTDNNGRIALVPKSQIARLDTMTPSQKALYVTGADFYTSPFYYTVDTTGTNFDVRVYHLDTPKAYNKAFVQTNDEVLLDVTVGAYELTRSANGYTLTISTSSSEDFKKLSDDQIVVQLSFIPLRESVHATLKGSLKAVSDKGERIYTFNLDTRFDLDDQDLLYLSSFLMHTQDPRLIPAPLEREFFILFATTQYPGPQWKPKEMDTLLSKGLSSDNLYAIQMEKITLMLGQRLKSLWCRANSSVQGEVFKTWDSDIPALYEKDVFEPNPENGSIYFFDEAGEIQTRKIHSQGDPILDASGSPVIKHKKGSVVRDAYGAPVKLAPRKVVRGFEILLFQGVYRFATDISSRRYIAQVIEQLVYWITRDLGSIAGKVLDNTRIYFFAKITSSQIDVLVENSLKTTMNAEQSLSVTLHVPPRVYSNEALKRQIESSVIKAIGEHFKGKVISLGQVSAKIGKILENDVIDVFIKGLGGERELRALTVIDDRKRLSIAKRLIAQSDDTLLVKENITFDFVRHGEI